MKNALGIYMGTDSAQTRQILTNKRATVYPYHYDPYSNKVKAEPARTDWTKYTQPKMLYITMKHQIVRLWSLMFLMIES